MPWRLRGPAGVPDRCTGPYGTAMVHRNSGGQTDITIRYTLRGMSHPIAGQGELHADRRAIPLYAQLAQLLRQRVYAGEFAAGSTLPSEQALRDEYGVSYATVRSALDLLRREGLIVTEHGVGSRVQEVPAQVEVRARPGDQTESRLPTAAERQRLELPEGVPLLVLRHPDGREELFSGLRAKVVFGLSLI